MEFKWMLILLLEITSRTVSRRTLEETKLSGQKPLKLDAKMDPYKNHVVKSVQSEDGDIIDCIDINTQPSLYHPALRNHIIQLAPSNNVIMGTTTTAETHKISRGRNRSTSMTVTAQLWQRSGSCPRGTIPIRRMKSKNLLPENPPNNYGRKKPFSLHHETQLNESKVLNLLQKNHSLAVLLTAGFAYLGAKGDIKVCSPQVEKDDEYSTSQISLRSGPRYNYELIESGWAVNPGVYGDRETRLFVYWTVDASKETGCFDLTCPGFIQTSNEVALGAAIYPISDPNGLPYQITLLIHKDPITSNWWVQYGETINIGYWPAELFSLIRYHAETVQWGGEVYSSRVGAHPHTETDMGTGYFADYIWQTSAVIKRMRVLENDMELKFPQWVYSYADEWNCYDSYYLGDYIEDPEFYYGGPGRNYKCP